MTRVVVGAFTPSVLLSVARETGRLAEQDLEVDEQAVTSSPAQFTSLLSGDLDVALTSPDNVLAYRFDPSNPLGTLADVRIVATLDRGTGLALYGRPGLRDLPTASPVLGVDVPTSGFALAMYAVLAEWGLDRADTELLALGSTPRRAEALRAGRCDATMLNAGNELGAEAAGCRVLGRVADVCSPYVGTVVCVHGPEHVESARRLSRALRSTARGILTGPDAPLAREQAALRLGLDAVSSGRYVERLASPREGLILEDDVDVEGLRTIVALRQRFLPRSDADGRDVLDGALEPAAGLIDPDGLSSGS